MINRFVLKTMKATAGAVAGRCNRAAGLISLTLLLTFPVLASGLLSPAHNGVSEQLFPGLLCLVSDSDDYSDASFIAQARSTLTSWFNQPGNRQRNSPALAIPLSVVLDEMDNTFSPIMSLVQQMPSYDIMTSRTDSANPAVKITIRQQIVFELMLYYLGKVTRYNREAPWSEVYRRQVQSVFDTLILNREYNTEQVSALMAIALDNNPATVNDSAPLLLQQYDPGFAFANPETRASQARSHTSLLPALVETWVLIRLLF